MTPDPLKPIWRTQAAPSLDAERLLAEVRDESRRFAAAIFWRDVREVGVSLLIVPLWLYLGMNLSQPWTWYLAVPAVLWIAGFLLIDRVRHPQGQPDPSEPLVRAVEVSLAQVEHQIRLLRNVGWWYLLPLALPMLAYVGHVNWRLTGTAWMALLTTVPMAAVVAVLLGGVYWLNWAVVRDDLEPRRRELQELLAGLQGPPPE
ncbi:MAG: hypothetical protein ACRC33_13220 [Gemmataceae bacterium]